MASSAATEHPVGSPPQCLDELVVLPDDIEEVLQPRMAAVSLASTIGTGISRTRSALNGERDKAIPAWAPRLFTRWSGLLGMEGSLPRPPS
jgi:hypothetical protein